VPKVLLDEGVPQPILRAFPEGEATTVGLISWSGIRNGDLLREAEAHGSDVLVTTDKNMRHQNSLIGRRLAVVVLPDANWPKLRGMLVDVVAAVGAARPGAFVDVPTRPSVR
jgi:hypothetical protein